MIPKFISYPKNPWGLLPPGIHDATMAEIYTRFVVNQRRKELYSGLLLGVTNLFKSGCTQLFLDGSYITEKTSPNDYDVCWDGRFVDPNLLDPVFLDFANKRERQKKKYLGEYFPALASADSSGTAFLDFFQKDKETGQSKGIIRIINYIK